MKNVKAKLVEADLGTYAGVVETQLTNAMKQAKSALAKMKAVRKGDADALAYVKLTLQNLEKMGNNAGRFAAKIEKELG